MKIFMTKVSVLDEKKRRKHLRIKYLHFLHMYKYATLKPVEVILRSGRGKRENNEGDKPN
jgi:hypothetical protein